eukprot:gnl/MRDRNA2_/MRDRNA2_101600_c0_seq1.p1 gnl/MRDRNA2_/MRDRNA2_101600_c0~~gnl/MRDRNA2_/MRDRNA2_101600_c0_seq1.p1  ORF type:complete len:230 (+),score=32.22 gnl/MRDRNA2_/MRDRNA2_101600_c0_seq1:127-816(+)
MATDISYDLVESSIVYTGDAVRLVVDKVKERTTGHVGERHVVVKGEFVVVVPFTSETEFVCIRQHLHPFQQSEVSFPTVPLKDGETPEDAARRGLSQLGCRSKRLVRLATLHEAPDTMRSVGHAYAALELEYSNAPAGSVRLNEAEFRRLIRRGEVRSTTTASAFFLLLDFQDRSRLTGFKASTAAPVDQKKWHCPVLNPFGGWTEREKVFAGLTFVMFVWARSCRSSK